MRVFGLACGQSRVMLRGGGQDMAFLDRMPLGLCIVAALGLGLAPFFPEPHLWTGAKLLMQGPFGLPDALDMALHLAPWILLVAKLVRVARVGR